MTLGGVAVAALVVVALGRQRDAACGAGFSRAGARCQPEGCPKPLALVDGVCDAPDDRVSVPETTFTVNTNDWEEVGRPHEAPLTIHTGAFAIDAFEVTEGHLHHARIDAARAASNVSAAEAESYCASRGGRLPTREEWFVVAAGDKDRRYPWGETGAVCRRAAWGLANGPCANGADGPDTVGAHSSGDSAAGVHDLAGNVAEWVRVKDGVFYAKGGSYKSLLAAELRTWSDVEPSPGTRDLAIGFRCAYDPK